MSKIDWNKKELTILELGLQKGWSYSRIHQRLKGSKSLHATTKKLRELKKDLEFQIPNDETTYEVDVVIADEKYWERKYKELHKKYHKSVKETTAVDRLVQDIKEIVPKSYNPAPKVAPKVTKKTSTPESLVVLLSDTHVGKVVESQQTLGISEYNFQVFLDRLHFLESRIISISRDHINNPLEELVIFILGDMADGSLSHGQEISTHSTIFQQVYSGAHAIAQFIRNLSRYFPKIRIESVVGNHTRFANQKKMPSDHRYSNYDQFMYAMIHGLIQNLDNVHWNLNKQPFAVTEVQGKTIFASHGDHLPSTGSSAINLPLHSMSRQITSMTQLMYKAGRPAPEYYVLGHLHRTAQLPHSLGTVIVNGGFPGLDNFALQGGFTPTDPEQVMFTMHPIYGKTGTWDIKLKFAKPGESEGHYQIPGEFKPNI